MAVHVDTHMKSLTAVFALSILLLVFMFCVLLGWYKVRSVVGLSCKQGRMVELFELKRM